MAKATLNLSLLSNKEFSRLVVNLLKDFEASRVTIEDAVLTKLKTRLAQVSDLYQASLAEIKSQTSKEDLAEADHLRDLDLQQLADRVRLGKYAKTPEEKEAYRQLKPLIKELNKFKYSNNEEESAFIRTLLTQLATTAFQAHLKSLDLTKIVASLTKSQQAFEALVQKDHSQTQVKQVYNTKDIRKDLQQVYTRLGDYLYILSEESTTPAYAKLYKVYATNSDYFKPLTRTKPKTSKKQADELVKTPEANQELPKEEKPETERTE